MWKEEDEESKKKNKKKSHLPPCDVAYSSVHMEVPRVHITAMSQGLTAQTNGGGNWLTFDNFRGFFEVS